MLAHEVAIIIFLSMNFVIGLIKLMIYLINIISAKK